jgi:hypothetical protein
VTAAEPTLKVPMVWAISEAVAITRIVIAHKNLLDDMIQLKDYGISKR